MAKLSTTGERLRYMLQKRGLSQSELAAQTGLNPSHVNRIVNDSQGEPSDKTLGKIAAILECEASWLRSGEAQIGMVHVQQQAAGGPVEIASAWTQSLLKQSIIGTAFPVLPSGLKPGDLALLQNAHGKIGNGAVLVAIVTTL